MKFYKQFIHDIKKYRYYIRYDVQSSLKAELSNTFLGYFWWLLDPLLNMGIYTFLFSIIFRGNSTHYPVYVFAGLLLWKVATTLMTRSTTCIKDNAGIIKQIYLPKFIIPLIYLLTNLVKFGVGLLLLFGMLFIFKIPLTWHIIEIIPVIILFMFFFYGISLVLTHLGVLFEDMRNIMEYVIMFWFFVSPGMWQPEMLPDNLAFFLRLNPVACFFTSMRNALIYGMHPMYYDLAIWGIVSVIIFTIGIRILYREDKNYTKVI